MDSKWKTETADTGVSNGGKIDPEPDDSSFETVGKSDLHLFGSAVEKGLRREI